MHCALSDICTVRRRSGKCGKRVLLIEIRGGVGMRLEDSIWSERIAALGFRGNVFGIGELRAAWWVSDEASALSMSRTGLLSGRCWIYEVICRSFVESYCADMENFLCYTIGKFRYE